MLHKPQLVVEMTFECGEMGLWNPCEHEFLIFTLKTKLGRQLPQVLCVQMGVSY